METNIDPGPSVMQRPAQPYVAIRGTVTMQTIPALADRIPEVFGWLAGRGVAPAGPPFLRYNLIDMERQLEIEAGVPVPSELSGDGEVHAGVLPAGRYAVLTHVGPFDQLIPAVRRLLDWAAERGLVWDMSETPEGQRWGCRLEIYKTNPAEEPDPGKWVTELAFGLAN
jgi:effector-binding domain-containing protein